MEKMIHVQNNRPSLVKLDVSTSLVDESDPSNGIFGERGKVTLKPGPNLLDPDLWGCISKRYLSILKHYKIGAKSEIVKETTPTLADIKIADMDAAEAIAFIETSSDSEALRSYLGQEKGRKKSRKSVITAIEAQIEVVEAKLSKDK